jgi:predicted small lipoprotein YifL
MKRFFSMLALVLVIASGLTGCGLLDANNEADKDKNEDHNHAVDTPHGDGDDGHNKKGDGDHN